MSNSDVNNLKRITKIIILSFIFLTASLPASEKIYLTFIPENVPISQAISASELVVNKRGWKTLEKNDESLKIQLEHRGYNAIMTLVYADAKIHYTDTTTQKVTRKKRENYGYGPPVTQIVETEVPRSWLVNIKNDITNVLHTTSLSLTNTCDKLMREHNLLSTNEVEERLAKLKKLFDAELVTEEDYKLKKRDILSRL